MQSVGKDTTLQIKRTFAEPRETVFRAWTDSKELERWFAPSDEYSIKAQLDLKVGGRYRVAMTHRPKKSEHVVVGTFREVRPPERLVYTWRWEGGDEKAEDTLVTVEFRDLGASTEVILTHERFPDASTRDEHMKGWAGCLDRLAAFVNR